MLIQKRAFRLIKLFLLYIIGISIIAIFFPFNMSDREILNYSVIGLSFVFLGFIFLFWVYKHDFDILEPISLITFMYMAIMIFAPLKCIITQDFSCFGVDVMDGAVKGTIVFIFSMLAFYIAYLLKDKKNVISEVKTSNISDHFYRNKILNVAYFMWFISLLLTLFYDFSSGRSPLRMLTFGNGGVEYFRTESTLQFLINFEFCLIPCWLYIYYYGRNKIIKILLFIITLSLLYVRGFRFIMLILILAPIILYYLLHKIRPNLLKFIAFCCISIFLSSFVAERRTAIRTGLEIEKNIFLQQKSNPFENVFQSDFTVFKTYYAIVDKIPELYPYQYGKEIILYTIILFIPRALWAGKPYPLQQYISNIAINEDAAMSGTAFINLGEFYFEWGPVGCFVCMFIFGLLAAKLKSLLYSNNDDDLILYSVLLPSCMQLIARGYVPSNFYFVLFLCLPVLIIKLLRKNMENFIV